VERNRWSALLHKLRQPKSRPAIDVSVEQDRALEFLLQGQLAQAEESFRDILKQAPDHFNALHLLGAIEFQRGRLEDAVQLICQALEINPKSEEAHFNMGMILLSLKRPEDALASFDRALLIQPDFLEALFNRGNVLADLKRPEDALASFDRALLIRPDFLEALFIRGNVLVDLNRQQDALMSYDRALAIKADFPEALNNRGNTLVNLKQPEDALVSLDRALVISPDFPEALNNRGTALMDLNRPEDALSSFDRALVISPDFPEAFNNRGTALMDLNRPEDALSSFDRALAINPDFLDALNNRGNVLVALKRTEDALVCFDRALAVRPEDADSHWNEALCRLLIGDFELGWKKYEWRWQTDRLEKSKREFKKPLWLGEQPLEGRTILLHAEQGLGDTLQFCRYATAVSARGAKVLLEVQPAVKSLLTSVSGVSKFFSNGEQLPDFDLHCPLLSLPLAFKTALDTIPSSIAYLHSDSGKVKQWQTTLGDKTAPRVGLVWTGGISNKYRSIPLIEFARLVSDKAQFISLQKEINAADRETLDEQGVRHFGNELKDFSDTAALLHLMDIVISVDTSVAHLAGAMGKPVWILLPFNADCRWLLDRDDSPWYPTAKLFRQPANGDWSSVIAKIEDELTRFLG
jgi:tetratricopeptide (TPR) repeat protein